MARLVPTLAGAERREIGVPARVQVQQFGVGGLPSDDVRHAALARFALEARDVIFERAADEVFGLLEHGWAAHQ